MIYPRLLSTILILLALLSEFPSTLSFTIPTPPQSKCRPKYLGASTSPTPSPPPPSPAPYYLKKTLQLSLPLLLSSLTDPLLSLTDTYYLSSSPKNLAALGVCTSIFHLSFNSFKSFSSATQSLVGSNKGEVELYSCGIALITGFIVLTLLHKFSTPILSLMGLTPSSPIYTPALTYLLIRAYSAPAVLLSSVYEGISRGYGNTVPSFISSVLR